MFHNAQSYSNNVSKMVNFLNNIINGANAPNQDISSPYCYGYLEDILDSVSSKLHHSHNLINYETFRKQNIQNDKNNVSYIRPPLVLFYMTQEPDFRDWYIPHTINFCGNGISTDNLIDLMNTELNPILPQ